MRKSIVLAFLVVQGLCMGQKKYDIWPKPVYFQLQEGYFYLPRKPTVALSSAKIEFREVAESFLAKIALVTGRDVQLFAGNFKVKNGINFIITKDNRLGSEGYWLEVLPQNIRLTAETSKGLSNGIAALLQMMPPEILGNKRVEKTNWPIACCRIEN